VTITGPTEARPADGLTVDFVVVPDRAQLSEIVRRARDGRVRTNIATSRLSTMPSPPSTRPRDARESRSSALIREDSELPNVTKVKIHAPKESLDVEHDYADRFLSHA